MMQKRNTFVYIITNIVNGKQYVGITGNPEHRWINHCNKKNDSVIARAIRKYGKQNFKFTVISKGTRKQISNTEIRLIAHLNTMIPYGYNVLPGGDFNPRLSGKNNPKAIKVVINGKKYGCIKDAAYALDIHPEVLRRHVRLKGPKFTYKIYDSEQRRKNGLGRKHTFATIQKLKNRKMPKLGEHNSAKSVVVNGHKYSCIKEAAIKENINYSTLRWRFQKHKCGEPSLGPTCAKPVLVNGNKYPSMRMASLKEHINYNTLTTRFQTATKSGEWPSGYKFL